MVTPFFFFVVCDVTVDCVCEGFVVERVVVGKREQITKLFSRFRDQFLRLTGSSYIYV